MNRRPLYCALSACLALITLCDAASGVNRHRRRFQAADLEQEEPGELNFDLETGIVRERDGYRALAPDFEISFGLDEHIELVIDSTVYSEFSQLSDATFGNGTFENTWTAARLVLLDHEDPRAKTAWSAGAQLGPRLPTAPGAQSTGYEAIAIVARRLSRLHLLVNAGGVLEPAFRDDPHAPIGIEAGFNAAYSFDDDGTLTADLEFIGIHYLSVAQDQAAVSSGLVWEVTPALDVSVLGLVGLTGQDRYGVLFGISPTVPVWH